MSDFTFVIFSYNAEKYIGFLLEKMIKHSFKCPIIIIDDGSIDQSLDVISSYTQRLRKSGYQITIIKKTKNLGVVDSWVSAIANVETPFFKPIAADDIFEDTDLDLVTQKFNVTGCSCILSKAKIIGNTEIAKNTIDKNRFMARFAKLPVSGQLLSLASSNNLLAPTAFYRTIHLKRILSEINNVKLIEDYLIWILILKSGSKIEFMDHISISYRIHTDQITQSKALKAQIDADLVIINKKIDDVIKLNFGVFRYLKLKWLGTLLNKALLL